MTRAGFTLDPKRIGSLNSDGKNVQRLEQELASRDQHIRTLEHELNVYKTTKRIDSLTTEGKYNGNATEVSAHKPLSGISS